MNLRQLEIFRAVMQTGTTSAAAHILGISQPAVSNMIRHTESVLGIKLFDRSKGRLWPTEEAKILSYEVESMFTIFRSVQQKVADLKEFRIGSIRVVATPSLAQSVVTRALQSFLADRPDVKVSLDVRRMENVIDQIEHNLADLGMTLTFEGHPTVEAKPMHLGHMVCIMPPDHPLTALDVVRAADIKPHTFITLERDTPMGNIIEHAFKRAGEEFTWSIETRYSNMASDLVEAGIGVAIVDEYFVRSHKTLGVAVRPFVPTIHMTAYALFSKLRPLSKLAKLFIHEVEDAFLDLSTAGNMAPKSALVSPPDPASASS